MTFRSAEEALNAAVRGALSRWTALTLTIENHHDRTRAMSTAETMARNATEMAARGRDATEIADLFQAGFDNLDTDIEDGSVEEVAALIIRVRDAAARGDFSVAQQLVGPMQQGQHASHARSVIKHEVEVEGEEEQGGCTSVQVEHQSRAAPPVDDDGFTTVVRRGR